MDTYRVTLFYPVARSEILSSDLNVYQIK